MEIRKSLRFIFIIKILSLLFIASAHSEKIEYRPKDAIQPYCLGNLNFDNPLDLEKIEIKVNKNKRWSKNLLNLHVYFQDEKAKSDHKNWIPEFRISDNYKKKFKSKILIKYQGSKPCTFDASIRITGDMWWHLGWDKGTPISSLNIELLNGHIKNITRFKLLLPASRYDQNEIFTSIFLKHLGFLSPRTFSVKAKINGFTSRYIFQEDLRKEFIENSLFREGPILEGDERFTVSLKDSEHIFEKKTNLSKLINKIYARKNIANTKIALESVSNLNLLYLFNHNALYPPDKQKNINLYTFSNKLFTNKKNIEILNTYEALIYAIDAAHSLSFDDRRFYYNPLEFTYHPIYYDGKSRILDDNQISSDKSLSSSSSIEAQKGASKATFKIININKDILLKDLQEAGVETNVNHLNKIILKIQKRLQIIENSAPSKIKKADVAKYFSLFNEKETKNKKLVFTNFDLKEFYICDFQLKYCDTLTLNQLDYKEYLSDALSQDFKLFNLKSKNNLDLIFVHSDMNYENLSIFSKKLSNWKKIVIESTILEFNDHIELDVDYAQKIIKIYQKNKNGLAIFKNGELTNWKIIFQGNDSTSSDKNKNFNPMNLTGCLTTYNVVLENVSFLTSDTFCEDSINFVNTNGNIVSIESNNSISDSIDMDFSNLNIKNIVINNALNDCLDLSYGRYIIDKIQVNKCGDKGVSVGEKSKLEINFLDAFDTNVALVSKDSSFVKLNSSNIENSALCFAAYRKKQEFSGGKIEIKKSNCIKKNAYKSKDSKIIFLK